MANQLDEMDTSLVKEQGRDINVIAKQIPVKVGVGSTLFEIFLWFPLIVPGIVFLVKKIKAGTYLRQLEQKIQRDASSVDNYLEQRVMILQNAAKLVEKAVNLDKETFTAIAEARSGNFTKALDGESMSQVSASADNVEKKINLAFENYPELKAHQEIADAMQQNSYLQKEITAAREKYNDTVNDWNNEIQIWPTKMIVAARAGYTTRVPFAASKEIKEKAKEVFF